MLPGSPLYDELLKSVSMGKLAEVYDAPEPTGK